MHEHIPHLVQTIFARQAAGLALTLAAMRAHVTQHAIDQLTVGDLVARCRRLFQTLQTQDIAELALALDAEAAVTIELHSDGTGNHYALRFLPPATFAARWQQLYPQQLHIDRWPGGLN